MTLKHTMMLTLLILLLGLHWSCQPAVPDTTPASQPATADSRQQIVSPDTLVYRYRDYTKTLGNCDSLTAGCARVEMRYPIFTQPLEDSIIVILNDVVQRYILSTRDDAGMMTGLDQFSRQFFDDYQIMRADIPDYVVNWEMIRRVEVLLNHPKVISLKSSEYAFTGGAHGMSATRLASYWTESGEAVKLSDLLIPDFDRQLNTIGEKLFRQQWEIPEDQDLDEAGFWFENNRFRLSDNFAVDTNGLVFLYNPYEVAPYSFGTLELTVDFREIRELLNPESPLFPKIMNQP